MTRFFGKRYTPKQLGSRTTTDGTDHRDMIAVAVETGACVFAKARGSVDELAFFVAQRLPPIVGWWSMEPGDVHYSRQWTLRTRKHKDCGHYSVVKNVTADAVTLMDPQDDPQGHTWGTHVLDRRTFDDIWYDTDTRRYVRVVRWYMILNYEGRRFSSKIPGGTDHVPGRGVTLG